MLGKMLAGGLLLLSISAGSERKVVFPGSAKPIGPYSPGMMAGDYLYVSGQGARDAQGKLPPTVEGQTQQCLENIKAIVEAAGLTMDHLVYTHTYLLDMNGYAAMNKVYATYFPGVLPARSTMGVARTPQDTPVEISAIAIRDKSQRQAVTLTGSVSPVPISPGILTKERFYLSGILGRDSDSGKTPDTHAGQIRMVLDRIARVLQSAGLEAGNVVHLNVYRTAEMPGEEVARAMRRQFPDTAISLLEVKALPFGVGIGVTGIAVRDRKDKLTHKVEGETVCASAGDTVYCAIRSASDVKPALDRLSLDLKAMGTSLSRAVANNVYLGNIEDFAKMNAAYAEGFPAPPPTRTTVQPAALGAAAFVTIGVIAIQ